LGFSLVSGNTNEIDILGLLVHDVGRDVGRDNRDGVDHLVVYVGGPTARRIFAAHNLGEAGVAPPEHIVRTRTDKRQRFYAGPPAHVSFIIVYKIKFKHV